jgi:hypothetical protein
MRNFDKVATVPERAIVSYQFDVNHTCLNRALSLLKGLRSFGALAFRVFGQRRLYPELVIWWWRF